MFLLEWQDKYNLGVCNNGTMTLMLKKWEAVAGWSQVKESEQDLERYAYSMEAFPAEEQEKQIDTEMELPAKVQ